MEQQKPKFNAPAKTAGNQQQGGNALTGIASAQLRIMAEIESSVGPSGIVLTQTGKACAYTAIGAVGGFLSSRGLSWRDIDMTALKTSVQRVALLELNIAGQPPELFVDYHAGYGGKPATVVLTIQSVGYERIVQRWADNIAPGGLGTAWTVREGDGFELPSYGPEGLIPPTWKPKLGGQSKKCLCVVYPVKRKDGTMSYAIAEREAVKANLLAHMHNSARRNPAFNWEKVQADTRDMGIDEILDSPDYAQFISPAWRDLSSREAMLIRKMKNNALRQIPLMFGSSLQSAAAEELNEDLDYVSRNETRAMQEGRAPAQLPKVPTLQDAEPEPEAKAEAKAEPEAMTAHSGSEGDKADKADKDGPDVLIGEIDIPF